jgi:hypothetical protein
MSKKEAFKIVSEFIKTYYPFAQGKNWDKKNGNLHFMLGSYSLQEYIETLADDEIDIESYERELNKLK